jgi:hypothetical protein
MRFGNFSFFDAHFHIAFFSNTHAMWDSHVIRFHTKQSCNKSQLCTMTFA